MSEMIYISHPYGGKRENIGEIEEIVTGLLIEYPHITFVSPVHTFGFLYDKVDYDMGINYCLELLKNCDEMWVFGDYMCSKGCNIEIEYCKKHNIPYKIFK